MIRHANPTNTTAYPTPDFYLLRQILFLGHEIIMLMVAWLAQDVACGVAELALGFVLEEIAQMVKTVSSKSQ